MFSSKFRTDDDFYKVMYDGGDEMAMEGEGDAPTERKRGRTQKERYADEVSEFKPTGFNRERGCTDPFFLLLFVSFLGSMLYLTWLGLQKGDIKKLLAPLDGDGRFCGINGTDPDGTSYDYTDFPKLAISDFSLND